MYVFFINLYLHLFIITLLKGCRAHNYVYFINFYLHLFIITLLKGCRAHNPGAFGELVAPSLFFDPHTIDSFASLEHGADKSHELVHHSTTFSLVPPP